MPNTNDEFQNRINKTNAQKGRDAEASNASPSAAQSHQQSGAVGGPRIERSLGLALGAVVASAALIGATVVVFASDQPDLTQAGQTASLPRIVTVAADLLGGGKIASDLKMSYILYQFESGKITPERAATLVEEAKLRDY